MARPAWDIERSLRRRFLVDTTLRVLGGFAVALLAWGLVFCLVIVLGSVQP